MNKMNWFGFVGSLKELAVDEWVLDNKEYIEDNPTAD